MATILRTIQDDGIRLDFLSKIRKNLDAEETLQQIS